MNNLFLSCCLHCVAALALTLTNVHVAAAQTLEPPRPMTPHWSHINLYDAGRALPLIVNPADSLYQWFLSHIDGTEANGFGGLLRSLNPTLKLAHHQTDLTVLAGPESVLLPESFFFHVAESTDLRFINPDGSDHTTVAIPGCRKTFPATTACRLQIYLGGSRRYVYNVFDGGFQAWKATQLLKNSGRSIDLVLLDDHAPGFIHTLQWGIQTIPLSGGSIREFNEYQVGPPGSFWDQAYNDGVVSWMGSLAEKFRSKGKAALLNLDQSFFHPFLQAQITALHGMSVNGLHQPDALIGGAQYQQFSNSVQGAVDAGGTIILQGTWCHTGPAGYTPGLYDSATARYRMWRLASYYGLKEPEGSTGMVYLDTAFCSNASSRPLYDQYEWLPAYQVNVGQPVSAPLLYQEGPAGRSSIDGRPCFYQIFSREYTRAMIFVRPQDGQTCNDYTDQSAITVPLPEPGRILTEAGTTSAVKKSILLRNAEAAILLRTTPLSR